MNARRLALSEVLLDQVSVKELASRMSNPTATSFHHLKKFLGHLKKTMDYCPVLEFPQAGEGYVKKGESCWRLETFSDSEPSFGSEKVRKYQFSLSTSGRRLSLFTCANAPTLRRATAIADS